MTWTTWTCSRIRRVRAPGLQKRALVRVLADCHRADCQMVKPSQTESNLGQTLVKPCQNRSNPLTISALPMFWHHRVKPSQTILRVAIRKAYEESVPSSEFRVEGRKGRKEMRRNAEHRTSNAEFPKLRILGVQRSRLDVRCFCGFSCRAGGRRSSPIKVNQAIVAGHPQRVDG